MEIMFLGNKELLKMHKSAFLASNTIPIEMVLKCYDWASGKLQSLQYTMQPKYIIKGKFSRKIVFYLAVNRHFCTFAAE